MKKNSTTENTEKKRPELDAFLSREEWEVVQKGLHFSFKQLIVHAAESEGAATRMHFENAVRVGELMKKITGQTGVVINEDKIIG